MLFNQELFDLACVQPAPCPLCGATMTKTHGRDTGPTVDTLLDQSIQRGRRVTLAVGFRATSPVTIIWSVDLAEVWRGKDRTSHGQTRLTIPCFDFQHHRRRFTVEVVDSKGRRAWTAGTLKIRL